MASIRSPIPGTKLRYPDEKHNLKPGIHTFLHLFFFGLGFSYVKTKVLLTALFFLMSVMAKTNFLSCFSERCLFHEKENYETRCNKPSLRKTIMKHVSSFQVKIRKNGLRRKKVPDQLRNCVWPDQLELLFFSLRAMCSLFLFVLFPAPS